MQIKLLQPGDEALHSEAILKLNDCEISLERSKELLSEPTYFFVAAVNDSNEVMGRIYGHVLHRYEQTDLLLYEVDVLEEHQRKGVGKAMLKFVRTLCTEQRFNEMWVLTEEDNVAGRALYSNCGGQLENSPVMMYVFDTTEH
jgi:GNAT superfamily N-acetyltransferase